MRGSGQTGRGHEGGVCTPGRYSLTLANWLTQRFLRDAGGRVPRPATRKVRQATEEYRLFPSCPNPPLR